MIYVKRIMLFLRSQGTLFLLACVFMIILYTPYQQSFDMISNSLRGAYHEF